MSILKDGYLDVSKSLEFQTAHGLIILIFKLNFPLPF